MEIPSLAVCLTRHTQHSLLPLGEGIRNKPLYANHLKIYHYPLQLSTMALLKLSSDN